VTPVFLKGLSDDLGITLPTALMEVVRVLGQVSIGLFRLPLQFLIRLRGLERPTAHDTGKVDDLFHDNTLLFRNSRPKNWGWDTVG
jgi:hypothetical protein